MIALNRGKRLFQRRSIFFSVFLILFSIQLRAETLQSLARKSALLLAASEDEDLLKKCKMSSEKISELSQQLKIRIDNKINKLKSADFQILAIREQTCEQDCSCSIYSLAFEAHNKKNQKLFDKAAAETVQDRKNCVSQRLAQHFGKLNPDPDSLCKFYSM